MSETAELTFKALGKSGAKPSKELETFPSPTGSHLKIKFSSKELNVLCPVTGQPDIYEIDIEYLPKRKCLESKSLKLYLWSFRDETMFAESLAHTISSNLFEALHPQWITVALTQNVRGGLTLRVENTQLHPLGVVEFPSDN